MAPYINRFSYWDKDSSEFIVSHLNNSVDKCVFIDIGANQGFIALQVFRGCNNIKIFNLFLLSPL